MELLETLNKVVGILFALCYAYQFLYVPVSLLLREKEKPPVRETGRNRYAALICARNEERVIGDLIDSLKGQTYPAERLDVYVMADNCSDGTAALAASRGATVYERTDRSRVGKGYALGKLLRDLDRDVPEGYDGYFVFDADNVLEPDYVEQMDRTFCRGYEAVTGYRNSKNYGDNWISAGYALWFLRESRFLQYPRYLVGSSCSVTGTGFLFSRKMKEETGGWPFTLLTEDLEFSVDRILAGERIGFCRNAVLYDEQPVGFRQSWDQRMRWSRGYLQVLGKYGGRLFRGMGKGSFSCFDVTMSILPAFILSAFSVVCNLLLGLQEAFRGGNAWIALRSALSLFGGMYGVLFVLGALTVATEWKRIRTTPWKKILYAFTFPLFMATYVPIAMVSLFRDTYWKPIEHRVTAAQAGLGRRNGT